MAFSTIKIAVPAMTMTVSSFMATNAISASFDCSNARSKEEIHICNIPDLNALDEEMGDLYKQVRKISPDPDIVLREQRQWIKSRRSECGPLEGSNRETECMRVAYRERIGELNSLLGIEADTIDLDESEDPGVENIATSENSNEYQSDQQVPERITNQSESEPETLRSKSIEIYQTYMVFQKCKESGFGSKNLNEAKAYLRTFDEFIVRNNLSPERIWEEAINLPTSPDLSIIALSAVGMGIPADLMSDTDRRSFDKLCDSLLPLIEISIEAAYEHIDGPKPVGKPVKDF